MNIGSLLSKDSKTTTSSTSNYSSADYTVHDSKIDGGENSIVNRDGGTVNKYDVSGGVVDAVTAALVATNEADAMNLRHLASTGENIVRVAANTAGNAAYEAGKVAENVSRDGFAAVRDIGYEGQQTARAGLDAVRDIGYEGQLTARKTADAAIVGNTNVARDALDFGESISRAGYDAVRDIGYEGQVTARSALVNNRESFRDVLDFGAGTQRLGFDAFNKAQQSQNDLIRYTNEQFTSKLAANSGDAVQNVTQNIFKYGMIAVGVIGVAFILRGSSIFKKA